MYADDVVVPEEHTDLLDRVEQQRRVILVESDVLLELGFDLNDIAIVAETERPPPKRRPSLYSKWVGRASFAYLMLGLLSVNAPGPLSGLGAARHVRLFLHLDHAVDVAAHAVTPLLS